MRNIFLRLGQTPLVSAGSEKQRARWERISLGAGHVMYRVVAEQSARGSRISWKGVAVAVLVVLLLIALRRV